jgi:hypothetical protein
MDREIISMRTFFIAFVMAAGLLSLSGTAKALTLDYTQDVILNLDNPAITFTVLAGSGADDIVISPDNAQITVPARTSFKLDSSQRGITLTATTRGLVSTLTCDGQGVAHLTVPATNASPQTFTVRPTALLCNNATPPPSSTPAPTPTSSTLPNQNPAPTIGPSSSPIPSIPPVSPSRVKLMRSVSSPKVYYITEKGFKRWIPTAAVFLSYGNKWQDVVLVSQSQLDAIPDDLLIKLPASPKIYKLENNKKRWVSNIIAFNKNGFSWDMVASVNQTELNYYATGLPIK